MLFYVNFILFLMLEIIFLASFEKILKIITKSFGPQVKT